MYNIERERIKRELHDYVGRSMLHSARCTTHSPCNARSTGATPFFLLFPRSSSYSLSYSSVSSAARSFLFSPPSLVFFFYPRALPCLSSSRTRPMVRAYVRAAPAAVLHALSPRSRGLERVPRAPPPSVSLPSAANSILHSLSFFVSSSSCRFFFIPLVSSFLLVYLSGAIVQVHVRVPGHLAGLSSESATPPAPCLTAPPPRPRDREHLFHSSDLIPGAHSWVSLRAPPVAVVYACVATDAPYRHRRAQRHREPSSQDEGSPFRFNGRAKRASYPRIISSQYSPPIALAGGAEPGGFWERRRLPVRQARINRARFSVGNPINPFQPQAQRAKPSSRFFRPT